MTRGRRGDVHHVGPEGLEVLGTRSEHRDIGTVGVQPLQLMQHPSGHPGAPLPFDPRRQGGRLVGAKETWGARTTTSLSPSPMSRSALVDDHAPPSMNRRWPMTTGWYHPGLRTTP